MPKNFLGKRIAVITAHPDDESLCGGTMYANHQAAGETFLICATYGEKGKSHLAKPVSDAALKKMRRDELLKAAKILKIDKVLFLGLPDAAVKENEKKLFQKLLPMVKELDPDQILSFGPDGVSGHWDHITVGKVSLRVAKKLKIPMAAITLSNTPLMTVRKKIILARRKFGKYAASPVHRKGDIKIKVDVATKRRAIRSHVSQFGVGGLFSQLPKAVADRIFAYEHFVEEKI